MLSEKKIAEIFSKRSPAIVRAAAGTTDGNVTELASPATAAITPPRLRACTLLAAREADRHGALCAGPQRRSLRVRHARAVPRRVVAAAS